MEGRWRGEKESGQERKEDDAMRTRYDRLLYMGSSEFILGDWKRPLTRPKGHKDVECALN
jgi:hypothetical protein